MLLGGALKQKIPKPIYMFIKMYSNRKLTSADIQKCLGTYTVLANAR